MILSVNPGFISVLNSVLVILNTYGGWDSFYKSARSHHIFHEVSQSYEPHLWNYMDEYLWVDSQYQPPVVDLNFFTLTHPVTMSDRVYLQSVSRVFFFSLSSEHRLPKLSSLVYPNRYCSLCTWPGAAFPRDHQRGRSHWLSFNLSMAQKEDKDCLGKELSESSSGKKREPNRIPDLRSLW